MSEYVVGGPYFEDLEIGDVFTEAPAVTLTPGLAAAHQSIVGNRLQLALDEQLSRRVLGGNAVMAHCGYTTRGGQLVLPRFRIPPSTPAG